MTTFFGVKSVNLREMEQLVATMVPTGLLKVVMQNLACQTQEKGSRCGVVYHQMDSLVLSFSMEQSRVQRIDKC